MLINKKIKKRSPFFLLLALILLLHSCSVPQQLFPLGKGKKTTLTEAEFKPIFKDDFKSFLFKSTMSYSDKFELGGMLMIKQLSEGNYRTVFMAKFGMTLFDFEFGTNGFIVHKTLEQMDNKMFLKIIEQDIEMLLLRNVLGQSATIFEKEKGQIIQTKIGKKTHFLVQEKSHLTEIYQGKKVHIQLSKYVGKIPHDIDIKHSDIPLKMNLFLLKH